MACPINLSCGSFTVIENGRIRLTTYDSVSVPLYSSALYHFSSYFTLNAEYGDLDSYQFEQ